MLGGLYMYTNRTFIRYITLSCAFFSYSQVIYICNSKYIYRELAPFYSANSYIVEFKNYKYNGNTMPLDGYR